MLYFELLIIVFLTVTNGLLAMSELAVVSSRKSRLEHLANQGSRGARAALRLIDHPSRFLSTVQIGITLVGVIAGAFSGATLGQRLGTWLDTFPSISPYGHSIGIGITVVGITYLSLIIGELVPKRIALTQPERVACLVAGPMRGLSLVAAPAVWVLHISTERVLRLLGLTGTRETTVTEDEVKSLVAEGTQAGIFVAQEQEMIAGVLRLADRSVRLIMTPRTRMVWVDVKSDRNAIIDMVRSHRFSRLLVCDATVDHPVGVIHTNNLLPEALSCEEVTLSELATPLLCVPDRTTVLKLLNRFKKEKVHLAVVVDEYGTTEGLVTLTDVIEAIAGDLPERGEDDGPQIVQRDDGTRLADGTVPTDEVETLTGIYVGENVEMLAGFVLDHLGRIPKAGASFNHGNARFEVVDMDSNRIDKVLIEVGPKEDKEAPDPIMNDSSITIMSRRTWMKRVVLFLLTNIAVMLVLSISARILGIDRFLTSNGLNMGMLLAFAALIGFGGSFISLMMSKTMAKWSTGAQVIQRPGIGYWISSIVFEILFGVLASIVVLYFSRKREYRAYAGAAALMGDRRPMIDALRALGNLQAGQLPKEMAASGIAGGGMMALFSSHPPLESRIAALQSAN